MFSLVEGNWILNVCLCISFYFILLILEKERKWGERERETLICCFTYEFIHLLIPVYALTED